MTIPEFVFGTVRLEEIVSGYSGQRTTNGKYTFVGKLEGHLNDFFSVYNDCRSQWSIRNSETVLLRWTKTGIEQLHWDSNLKTIYNNMYTDTIWEKKTENCMIENGNRSTDTKQVLINAYYSIIKNKPWLWWSVFCSLFWRSIWCLIERWHEHLGIT